MKETIEKYIVNRIINVWKSLPNFISFDSFEYAVLKGLAKIKEEEEK